MANPLQSSILLEAFARVTHCHLIYSSYARRVFIAFYTRQLRPSRSGVCLLARRAPVRPIFFFTDDSVIFCRASLVECRKIQDLLECYEKAAGQQLNRSKTSLFFSKSMPPLITDQIKDALGVQKIKQFEKYLGLPSLVGRNKKASLLYIKERVEAKLQGWKE